VEFLPAINFKRVRNRNSFWLAWLIDICAQHADNRQAIFEQGAGGWLDAHFIDHGHLFGGPNGDLKKNFRASRYLDPRIYPALTSIQILHFQRCVRALCGDQLWRAAAALPEDWKTTSATDGFAQFLNRLETSGLVESVFDTMLDSVQRYRELESSRFEGGNIPPCPIPRSGIQGVKREQRQVDFPAYD
jgi:hypothetical protein